MHRYKFITVFGPAWNKPFRLCATAAILLLGIAFYPMDALVVRSARGSGLLWAEPVEPGSVIGLSWVHSVSNRPVLETYTVDASGGIRLTAMVFDHEGPNLPHGPERGSTWNFLGPRVMVTGYSILLDEMNIAIAAGQRLECGQWEWDMESAVGRDTPVRVRIERVPIICIQATRVLQSKTLTVRY